MIQSEELSTIEKFLRYVQIDTQSSEDSETTPSTLKQHTLAKLLVEELQQMGAEEIVYDTEHCYVYASVPATQGRESAPVLGFIAHMDTSPAVSGSNVKPRIVKNYDGEDIVLHPGVDGAYTREKTGMQLKESEQSMGASGKIVMRVEEFPELKAMKGQDLIVTDGATLLGADDKAGVAEIMAMAEYLLKHTEIPHGKIRIGFTPDEEIGCGADYFDLSLFAADYAYTVDGGALGELEYENFNAAGVKLTVNGRNTHPGSAKGKMKNAILIAQEFQGMLPTFQNPIYTEGYEGFYHLDGIHGNVEQVVCDYIIRDHDRQLFEQKKAFFLQCADFLNQKYGEGTICPDMKDSYYNMREIMEDNMHLVHRAKQAMEELGVTPVVSPIRGGTDGARLSFMGLPCPNLCTGGANYHSRFEYASVQGMETTTIILIRLAEMYGGSSAVQSQKC